MAMVKRMPLQDGMKVAGAIIDEFGAAIPYVAIVYAVTKSITDYALAASANQESCRLLADRAMSIQNRLVAYFGPDSEKLKNKTHDLMDKMRNARNCCCALRAKNYLGEFQACGDRLTELELQVSNIIIFKMARDQEQNHQESMRNQEQNQQELLRIQEQNQQLLRALQADRERDRLMLERELRALPERLAVLQMHSMSTNTPNPYVRASNSMGGNSVQPQLVEPWFIDVADVQKEERTSGKKGKYVMLGTGGFGTVFRGTCMGETVAIKQVNSSGEKAIQELKNELEMMWRVSHENIIQTHGGFYPLNGVKDHEDELPLIVLEYAPKGSLENYIFADGQKTLLPKDVLLSIFRGVLDGLKYLHASNVIHRDIKPQNILLMDDWTPKISDFGVATVMSSFYDHMGVEGAIAAAKSRTAQNVASPSGFSTAKVDALSGEFSHVTVASGGSVAQSSSTGSRAAGPSGMRPVRGQAQALSADEHLRHAEDWEKAGNMAYAYEYFKLAAEAGVVEGQFRLGKILLDGSHGMRQHLEHGAGWVRAAAENGRTDAMIEYGRCHHSGRGVPQNWSLAKEWYAKAAKLGSSAGSEWIKALEAEEQTALRSRQLEDEKTRMQREREAEEHAAAARQAATEKRDRLEQERKIWPSESAAKGGAKFAARRAAAAAATTLRRRHWQQRGRTEELDNKNFAQALVWYRKAAHVGDAYAQFKLGNFYQEGLGGLPQDMRAAVEWYCKAAEQGDTLAQKKLKKLGY
ncbi:putative cysteine-rich receptor-like protein kinase 39 [Porphyridium purpureum]|uniref:Putative cysteine-rich receptor-like protein kinase 39 n=1 Tax=Porphyridium purpureum TaxID=35688 RepID=A0A5J4YI61_PORPP|nr:putative cysteine-rich receptor-like protein kinase 39 [Porphyridium purpureum]|eukprot:POR8299..scf218_34